MQSQQLGSVGGGAWNLWSEQPFAPPAEDVIHWVGNPGRPPYVIPCGSAGLKKFIALLTFVVLQTKKQVQMV